MNYVPYCHFFLIIKFLEGLHQENFPNTGLSTFRLTVILPKVCEKKKSVDPQVFEMPMAIETEFSCNIIERGSPLIN